MNWTCDETRRHLLRQDELSAAALEHLARCAVCQEMMELPPAIELDSGSNANAGALDFASLLSQTQLQLSQERGLLAGLRSRRTPLRHCDQDNKCIFTCEASDRGGGSAFSSKATRAIA